MLEAMAKEGIEKERGKSHLDRTLSLFCKRACKKSGFEDLKKNVLQDWRLSWRFLQALESLHWDK